MIKRNRFSLLLVAFSAVFGFLFARAARAVDLPLAQAGGGISWTGLAIGVGVAVVVAGAVLYFRHNPGQVFKLTKHIDTINAEGKLTNDLAEAATKLSEALNALSKITAPTNAEPAPPPAEPHPQPVAPGKNGQAGPLTIQCTGDPKVDHAAFDTQYFG